jgi:hypothetical protein
MVVTGCGIAIFAALAILGKKKAASTNFGSYGGGESGVGGEVSGSSIDSEDSGIISSLMNLMGKLVSSISGAGSGSKGGSGSGNSAQNAQANAAGNGLSLGSLTSNLNSYFGDSKESSQLASLLQQGDTVEDAANTVGESPREVTAALVDSALHGGESASTIDSLTQDVETALPNAGDALIDTVGDFGILDNYFSGADPFAGIGSEMSYPDNYVMMDSANADSGSSGGGAGGGGGDAFRDAGSSLGGGDNTAEASGGGDD